jgi:hypothetical protein
VLVWMKWESDSCGTEEHTTPEGTQKVWSIPVEYRVTTQAS